MSADKIAATLLVVVGVIHVLSGIVAFPRVIGAALISLVSFIGLTVRARPAGVIAATRRVAWIDVGAVGLLVIASCLPAVTD